MRIGIFDSGLGGLTILKEFLTIYPQNEYFYFGDNIHTPFGEKSQEELLQYANEAINFFEAKKVDEIIFACGTISSTIFPLLSSNLPLFNILEPTIDTIR